MKICGKCKVEKPNSCFSADRYKRDKLCSYCKECARAQHAALRGHRRFYSIKSNYGLTKEEHDRMFEAQNGVCAICKSTPNKSTNNTMSLHVDHDHETGEVRGLLCHKCNAGLGFFNDSLKLVQEAAKYLET